MRRMRTLPEQFFIRDPSSESDIQLASSHFLLLPVSLQQRVLDIVSVPGISLGGDVIGVLSQKVRKRDAIRPHQLHADLYHDPSRGEVVLVGCGKYALHSQLSEALADQRT